MLLWLLKNLHRSVHVYHVIIVDCAIYQMQYVEWRIFIKLLAYCSFTHSPGITWCLLELIIKALIMAYRWIDWELASCKGLISSSPDSTRKCNTTILWGGYMLICWARVRQEGKILSSYAICSILAVNGLLFRACLSSIPQTIFCLANLSVSRLLFSCSLLRQAIVVQLQCCPWRHSSALRVVALLSFCLYTKLIRSWRSAGHCHLGPWH